MLPAYILINIFERLKILKSEKCFKVFGHSHEKEILVRELMKICEFYVENFSAMTFAVFCEYKTF
jgi:hypothetical protein